MTDVRGARRQYAAFVAALGASGDQRIEAAFAAVERERHCGDALWLVAAGEGYVRRPSPDPDFLYRNAAIGLVPERGLNNGEPGSHALWLKAVEPKAGECGAHFGAGVGYYTAILADCANVFVHTRSGAAGVLGVGGALPEPAGALGELPSDAPGAVPGLAAELVVSSGMPSCGGKSDTTMNSAANRVRFSQSLAGSAYIRSSGPPSVATRTR